LIEIEQVAQQLPLDIEKQAIIQLIEAMRQEMSGDPMQALEMYVRIEEPTCRRVGLQCASNIAINHHRYQDAMVILEELCRFSYDYMLPYAELVDLLGQTEFAANIIKLYITQKPEAYLANLKLANMYSKLGQLQEAQSALEQVLAVDPENKTAQYQLSHLSSPV
jgi:predicted Zn-dependent protease